MSFQVLNMVVPLQNVDLKIQPILMQFSRHHQSSLLWISEERSLLSSKKTNGLVFILCIPRTPPVCLYYSTAFRYIIVFCCLDLLTKIFFRIISEFWISVSPLYATIRINNRQLILSVLFFSLGICLSDKQNLTPVCHDFTGLAEAHEPVIVFPLKGSKQSKCNT